MNKIEFIEIVKGNAVEYIKKGVLSSLKRNSHMNKYGGEPVTDETINAIFVDFINFIAYKQGIDYAMYTTDLEKELKKE